MLLRDGPVTAYSPAGMINEAGRPGPPVWHAGALKLRCAKL